MQVFAWGLNSAGQLGMGDSVSRKSPCAIEALWAMPVQQLAAGLACHCVPVRFFLIVSPTFSTWQTSAHQLSLSVAREVPAEEQASHTWELAMSSANNSSLLSLTLPEAVQGTPTAPR